MTKRHYCAKSLLVSRPVLKVLSGLVVALALGACRGGCVRRAADDGGPLGRTFALLPQETRLVAALDVAAVRNTRVWQRLTALAQEDAHDRRKIEEFAVRTGVDPIRHIHRITAAFPDDARRSGHFVLLVEGQGLDEKRLVAYARDQALLEGSSIEARTHRGRTVWNRGGADGSAAVFLGPQAVALGASSWVSRVAELASGADIRDAAHGELARLCARISPGRALWFAALVPEDLRRALMADPRFGGAASVTRLAAGVDLGPGLDAELVAELSNATDAKVLAERVQASLRQAKGNPRVLLLGLAPYLDAVAVRVQGPTLHLALSLPEAQIDDLLSRVEALTRAARDRRGSADKR